MDSSNTLFNQTQWIKFRKVKQMHFIGKETLAFSGGCYILFYDVSEGSQLIYRANSDSQGDGVQCLAGHRTANIFAFAEKCHNPRILVFSYPSFTRISSLRAGSKNGYLALAFTEMEHLISLGAHPNFAITVWSWRSGEMLTHQDSGTHQISQKIRCTLSTPTFVSQLVQNSHTFLLWEVHLCYKQCLLVKHEIEIPDSAAFLCGFIWTPEGVLHVVDELGNIYTVESDKCKASLIIPWERAAGTIHPSIAWFKSGIVVSGPSGEVVHYKRTLSEWTYCWHVCPKYAFATLVASPAKDLLLGITIRGEVLQLKIETNAYFARLKNYGNQITSFAFIYPTGEYIATINSYGDLMVWDKISGEMVGGEHLGTVAITMASNPIYPYVAVGRRDGILDCVNVFQPHNPNLLAQLKICDKELSYVQFTTGGKHVVACTKRIGHFFLIKCTPGDKINVLNHVLLGEPIIDFSILDEEPEIIIIILMRSTTCCFSGDTFHIYSGSYASNTIVHRSTIDLKCLYTGIIANPMQTRTLFGTPHHSRQLHILELNEEMDTISMKYQIPSGHQIRKFYMQFNNPLIITFGMDGIILLRSASSLDCTVANIVHHRKDSGVRKAKADPLCKYIITLGEDGQLVCTCLRASQTEDLIMQQSLRQSLSVPAMSKMFISKKTSGFKLSGADEGKSWIQIQDEVKILQEKLQSISKKNKILEDFVLVQEQVVELLEKNYDNPPEEQLPIKAFDLDVEIRQKRVKETEDEIKKIKAYMTAVTKAQDKLCEKLKQCTWEKMEVKAKRIKAILGIFDVENYSLLPEDMEYEAKVKLLIDRRMLMSRIKRGESFRPWIPKTESKLQMELSLGPKLLQEEGDLIREAMQEAEQEHDDDDDPTQMQYTFSGSSSHQFIELSQFHTSQFEMVTYTQAEKEILLLRKDTHNLRLFFNKNFNEVCLLKDREMNLIMERNERLRYLLSELNDTSKTINDPELSPYERPETIMTVVDKEVKVLPYISPSEQTILDKLAAEAEARRLAELADNFRERALMEMMDGVLELRWEDKIKKDIPLPKCMIEKQPEDYNEDDLRAIKEYVEKVKFLMSERERYRKMCEAEFKKVSNTLRESTLKFDGRLADLFLMKLKVEASIGQENLKMVRAGQKFHHQLALHERECQVSLDLYESDKLSKQLSLESHYLHEATGDCRVLYESLVARDKLLDKGFKKEFPNLPPFILEQLYKMYKRRPKMQQRAQMSVTLLNELSRCSVSTDKPTFLPSECLDFLKGLDGIDSYTNTPPNVDDEAWNILCHVRRLKVECELKIKACALELAEADTTVNIYQKKFTAEREKHNSLLQKLNAVRSEKLHLSHNIQIQIVMKQGLVEIPTTGTLEDFCDSILINRLNVESINAVILEAGRKKLNAMHEMTNFHRVIMCKEWEHKKLNMQIQDLRDHLATIEGIKVTKDIQMYLRRRAMGLAEDKCILSLDKEIALLREAFEKLLKDMEKQIMDIDLKIEAKMKANRILDKQILDLNVNVNEQQLDRDLEFETKEYEGIKKKMEILMKRSRMVANIQKQHNEILVLQTELELIRLKTFPTLKYTTLI